MKQAVLITGASTGIGRLATAEEVAALRGVPHLSQGAPIITYKISFMDRNYARSHGRAQSPCNSSAEIAWAAALMDVAASSSLMTRGVEWTKGTVSAAAAISPRMTGAEMSVIPETKPLGARSYPRARASSARRRKAMTSDLLGGGRQSRNGAKNRKAQAPDLTHWRAST